MKISLLFLCNSGQLFFFFKSGQLFFAKVDTLIQEDKMKQHIHVLLQFFFWKYIYSESQIVIKGWVTCKRQTFAPDNLKQCMFVTAKMTTVWNIFEVFQSLTTMDKHDKKYKFLLSSKRPLPLSILYVRPPLIHWLSITIGK